ncbi:RNA polymerase sigma factor [Acidipila sp. EB88]|uniref:RNA polymerase sigma factor n=1 Tax=Acidipila sp. EB88 TaxID=2305226 RepID=UPI000F5F86F5|nr:sigma-70 family RNA polymerase sigma factor [Acidipila sp. EB88]RRA49285.1 sigma-70 family RNA polymerase sigma factor [Acidipila sp. EB88]
MQRDIDQLVMEARAGKADAFAELMARYHGMVRRTAFSILNNADDADDIVQEVSLKVFCKLHTFQSQAAFSTWLTRIAINTSLLHLRKSKRSKLSSLDGPWDEEDLCPREVSDPAPGPEQQYISNEARKWLYEGIGRLPSSMRDVLMDRVYGDLSMDETARRNGVSVAVTKSRTLRARAMLTERLRKRGMGGMRSLARDHPKTVSRLGAG